MHLAILAIIPNSQLENEPIDVIPIHARTLLSLSSQLQRQHEFLTRAASLKHLLERHDMSGVRAHRWDARGYCVMFSKRIGVRNGMGGMLW